MHFDDTEELQEPKLFCYRRRWIASRALIWAFVAVGATLFSIGYVLKVFTAHYPDDPNTASIFEISGLTLVSLGAALTGLGIVACFHSCCVVLCHRPTPEKSGGGKGDSQKSNNTISEKSEKSATVSALPISHQNARPNNDNNHAYSSELATQQQPLLANGSFYPMSPNSKAEQPNPPTRSFTSPKFEPAQDDNSTASPWSQMHGSERRRHKSQGNIVQPQQQQQQQDWSDSERPRHAPVLDKSPENGKTAHPYNDDFLQQHLRKKLQTSENAGGSQNYTGRIRAKPIFGVGPPAERREAVWESNQQSDSTSKSPPAPPRSGSVRHRQYFHEEHFAFSDFDPDDAMLQANEQQHLLQHRNEAPNLMATSVPVEQQQARLPSRSPLLAGAARKSQISQQQFKHVYANNSNITNSPKPSHIIPSSSVTVPVSSSPHTSASKQHHHHHRSQQQQPQHFAIDIDSSNPVPRQVPGSRVVDMTMATSAQHSLPPSSVPAQQPSSTFVSASPYLVRRVSPGVQRKQSPSHVRNEQTPDYYGLDQSSGPDMEMRDLVKPPNGRIMFNNSAHCVSHRPVPETVAFNTDYCSSAVIRGQLPNQRRFNVSLDNDEDEDADNDNTPDPEDAFPAPKMSPKRDRLIKASETKRNVPPSTSVHASERTIMTSRNKPAPGVVSPALVSHLPAQDPYPTTQAFLCEQEEII